jgi:hypothetical protein
MDTSTHHPHRPLFRIGLGLGAGLVAAALVAGCGSTTQRGADPPATTAAPIPATTAAPVTSTAPPAAVPPTTAPPTPTTAHRHDGPVPTTIADNGDDVFDVVASEYAFTLERPVVNAGLVRMRLTNHGGEPHQLQIGRVGPGVDADRFVKTYQEEGEAAAFRLLSWVGGVNAVPAGASGTATARLDAGDYLVVCFFPAPDGSSHVMKHMVAPLHVEAAGPPAAVTLDVASTVILADYRITVPPGFRGQGTVAFTNQGAQPHEVVLVRLNDGKTVADAVAYKGSPQGPPPYTFAGGISTIAAGSTGYADLALAPGTYIATCFVPGPAGIPHADMGMVAVFEVK